MCKMKCCGKINASKILLHIEVIFLAEEWMIRSWERSRSYNIEANAVKDAGLEGAELKQFIEQHAQFLHEVHPTLNRLSNWTKRSQTAVGISDAKGYIIEIKGKLDFLNDEYRSHLRKGACWSEKVRGTNSAGTAIIEKRPIAVVGKEHYLESNHTLYCVGAPIFDPTGRLIGVFNISGYYEKYHPTMLGFADMISKEMEDWMLLHRSHDHIVLALVKESADHSRALLSINKDGFLSGANREARAFLKLDNDKIGHIHISEIFSNGKEILKKKTTKEDLIYLENQESSTKFLTTILFDNRRSHFYTGKKKALQLSEQQPKQKESIQSFHTMYGTDEKFIAAIQLAKKAAKTDYPIIIHGESGTGKDLLAQSIHQESPRSGGPFVAINCGAITKSLLESELFGYEAGSFTGAKATGHIGKLEQANGGTLFMDEIAEMPPEMQVALLRVLQDYTITRVGGTKPIPIDIRIIAASHRDLWEAVQNGEFRADLFYRLQGINIFLPPLRLRSDRLQLANIFLNQIKNELGKNVIFSRETVKLIETYHWPGNIRQMISSLREAAFLCENGIIEPHHFPQYVQADLKSISANPSSSLQQVEHTTILEVLKKTEGNISQAAKILGIGRNTLYRKLKNIGYSSFKKQNFQKSD